MKTIKHEQIPVETSRPIKPEGEISVNDTYPSIKEEYNALFRETIFNALISPSEEEEFWKFLRSNDYRIKTRKNAQGEDEFVGIEDSRGKLVWFVDFDWYRKIAKLEKDSMGYYKEKRAAEETDKTLPKVPEEQGITVVDVQPETDPQKIN